MNRIPFLVSLFALSLGFLVVTPQAYAQDSDEQAAHGDHADHDGDHAHMEDMENPEVADPDVILDVSGLHCEDCAYSLRKELDNLDAVEQSQVIVEGEQQIRIALSDGQTLTEEAIQEAVVASGFEDEFELKGVRFPKVEG